MTLDFYFQEENKEEVSRGRRGRVNLGYKDDHDPHCDTEC